MSRTLAFCIIVVAGCALFTIAVVRPEFLSDGNAFLKGFVNQELLSVLGVILAITLGSASQLHLALNRIEEEYRQRRFVKVRANIKQSASWLIGLFTIAVVLVVVKPLVAGATAEALFNAGALLIMIVEVLLLIDMMELAFAVPAIIKDKDDARS